VRRKKPEHDMSEEFDGLIDGPLPSADGSYPPGPSRRESDARAAKGQSRKTGKPLWVTIPAFMAGDAWLGMTPAAREVVMCILAAFIKLRPDKRNNGAIAVSYGDFARRGIRRQSVTAAVERAEKLGFIIVKQRDRHIDAAGNYAANTYGLTFLPWGGNGEADVGSNEWASEKCEALGRELAAEEKLKRRKNPAGEANIVLFNKSRSKKARAPR
jgi:hypothetical protein